MPIKHDALEELQKTWWMFAGPNSSGFYAKGGMQDFKRGFDDLEKAMTYCEGVLTVSADTVDGTDWVQLFNKDTHRIVYGRIQTNAVVWTEPTFLDPAVDIRSIRTV